MNPYARHLMLKLQRATRGLSYVVSGLLLSSCAHQYVEQLSQVSANSMIHHVPTANGVEECRELMAANITSTGAELDSSNIRLLNWNIQKQRNADSAGDLRLLANDKDLVLIQEASLREETINDVDSSKHWSFAPGYLLSKIAAMQHRMDEGARHYIENGGEGDEQMDLWISNRAAVDPDFAAEMAAIKSSKCRRRA